MYRQVLIGAALALGMSSAHAIVFDFGAIGEAAGDHGATELYFRDGAEVGAPNGSGLEMTASGMHGLNVANAYLDAFSGGLPAGLGLCKNLRASTASCNPADDDNVEDGEVLSTAWNQAITGGLIELRDADHFVFVGTIEVSVDGGAFNAVMVNGSAFLDGGTTYDFRVPAGSANKFYIEKWDTAAVPTSAPGAVGLLSLGALFVFSGGALRRWRAS